MLKYIFSVWEVHNFFSELNNLLGLNSRCASIAWVPNGDGTFVVAHADGNLYVYEKASL